MNPNEIMELVNDYFPRHMEDHLEDDLIEKTHELIKEMNAFNLRELDVLSDDNFFDYICLVHLKDPLTKWDSIKDKAISILTYTDCRICTYSILHGWWGDSYITHCRDCHKTWQLSSTQAHCTVCHLHFKSSYLYDLHLGPNDIHLASPVHKSKHFYIDETGVWRQEAPSDMAGRFGGAKLPETITPSAPSESTWVEPFELP